MKDFNLRKYLAESKLLKEEIMIDTTVMVDPNNTLMSNASDEEIDYVKANITNVPKMPVEDFMRKYDEYLDRFYDEADPLDNQIKALQIHIDKGVLTREEAMEALAVLQGQDIEDYEDTFLAESKILNEEDITDENLANLMKTRGTADVSLWHITKLIKAGIIQDSEKEKALKAVDYDF